MTMKTLIDAFAQRLLVPAPFQRDADAWENQKRLEWAKTLGGHDRLWGTFCVYRLFFNGIADGNLFLADGYQRISQAQLILEAPQAYALEMSCDELAANLTWFQVTVQYDELDSHDTAFQRFQRVNLGTALTPADFSKGYLTELKTRIDIYHDIPLIVERVDSRIGSRFTISNRSRRLVSKRGSFALLYQYASETKQSTFWRYASPKLHLKEKQVEQHLATFLSNKSDDEIRAIIRNFDDYLHDLTATIEQEVAGAYPQGGYSLPQTVFRALLHLGIYRKNNGISIERYREAIRLVLELTRTRPGQLLWPDDKDPQKIFSESVAMQDLKPIIKVCKLKGIPLLPEKRRRQRLLKKGYDNSHMLPFSEYGDNTTFPEPGPINRARGANPVER